MHEENLEIRLARHGCDISYINMANSLIHLRLVYKDQQNYREVEKFRVQSHDMYRKVHGENSIHSDITCSISDLATVYKKHGKSSDAL